MPAFFADADQTQMIGLFLPWIGLAIAVFALFASLRADRRKRLIDNLPTSKTQGVFIGLVELKGTVQCEQPLVSYLAGSSCVYYSYAVEERWSRLVTEQESDGRGGTRTVTQRESGWTTVASATESTPFYVQDDTGSILVRPEGARTEAQGVVDRNLHTVQSPLLRQGPGGRDHGLGSRPPLHRVGHPGAGAALPRRPGPRTAGRRRARNRRRSQGGGLPHLRRTQEQVSSGLGWQIWLFFFLGAITAPGGHVAGALS